MDDQELLTLEELSEIIPDLDPMSQQYESLCWLRDIRYLEAEGFVTITGDRIRVNPDFA